MNQQATAANDQGATVTGEIVSPPMGPIEWIARGYRAHCAAHRHELHTARSFAAHRHEFGPAQGACLAVAIERIQAFGRTFDDALRLLNEALAARAARVAKAS